MDVGTPAACSVEPSLKGPSASAAAWWKTRADDTEDAMEWVRRKVRRTVRRGIGRRVCDDRMLPAVSVRLPRRVVREEPAEDAAGVAPAEEAPPAAPAIAKVGPRGPSASPTPASIQRAPSPSDRHGEAGVQEEQGGPQSHERSPMLESKMESGRMDGVYHSRARVQSWSQRQSPG